MVTFPVGSFLKRKGKLIFITEIFFVNTKITNKVVMVSDYAYWHNIGTSYDNVIIK